jgi:hypothetical protein
LLWSHFSLLFLYTSLLLWEMYMLSYHCMLKVCNFLFDFTRAHHKEFALSLRTDFGLGVLRLWGLLEMEWMHFTLWSWHVPLGTKDRVLWFGNEMSP